MLKKVKFSLFSFNSDETGLTGRNLKHSGSGASQTVQKKHSFIAALSGDEQPGYMAGLLLVIVALLHVWLALWLLMPVEMTKKSELNVMEVSMVAMPGQKAEVTPPAPPKPEPPKKPPPIKKKAPVIPKKEAPPKTADIPMPQPSAVQQPSVSAPTVTAPQAASHPEPAVVNNEPKISSGVVPLERVPPKYPVRAANRHIEGWVKVEFTITTSGDVKNAVVVEAEPTEIFDEAALDAIGQWKFREKIVNGVAVEQRAVQTMKFNLTR